MAETTGIAGQCSAEYTQALEGLEATLGADLPDCARLDVAYGASAAGPFEGINATSKLENGKQVTLTFDELGACFESQYLPGRTISESAKNCSGAKSLYSLSIEKAAAAILKAKEIQAKF